MAETVAVQILPDAVLLAHAESGSQGPRLTELVRHALQAEENAYTVAVAMIRQRKIENIGLAVLVNWDQYSIRDSWLPFTSAAQIVSTIKFELEDDLDQEAANLLVPFQILEQRPDSSHVLAWASNHESVGTLLKSWDAAGLSPEYMPPDAAGHLGLVRHLVPDLAGQPLVVVSGDDTGVDLTLVSGTAIWARRRIGGLSWATEAAGRPLQEIRRTFLNSPGFPSPVAVISFGGEAADTVARVVSDDLGCEFRSVPRPELPGDSQLMYWPQVAGVALLMAGGAERPLTFRIEAFEPQESSQIVQLLSVVAVGLLGVCFLVGGVMFIPKTSETRKASVVAREQAAQYWKEQGLDKIVAGPPPSFENFDNALGGFVRRMQAQAAANRGTIDAVEKFNRLAMVLAPLTTPLKIKQFDIMPAEINLRGSTTNMQTANELTNQIKASQHFGAEAKSVNADPKGGDTTFDIRITYKPGK